MSVCRGRSGRLFTLGVAASLAACLQPPFLSPSSDPTRYINHGRRSSTVFARSITLFTHQVGRSLLTREGWLRTRQTIYTTWLAPLTRNPRPFTIRSPQFETPHSTIALPSVNLNNETKSSWVLLAVLLFLVYSTFLKPKPKPVVYVRPKPLPKKEYTPVELAEFDGTEGKRILMAVSGNVYDVTLGRNFYGPGACGTFRRFITLSCRVDLLLTKSIPLLTTNRRTVRELCRA